MTTNLLPDKMQHVLAKERKVRTAAILLAALFLTGLIALAALAPAFLNINAQKTTLEKEAELIGDAIARLEEEPIADSINAAKKILTVSTFDRDRTNIIEIIVGILESAPAAISLTRINYEENKGEFAVVLSGEALTREALVEFIGLLRTDPSFNDVDAPISQFARESDIKFEVTIK